MKVIKKGKAGAVPTESPKADIVDPDHPVDYAKAETPPSYRCQRCGTTGHKLWREYNTFLSHQTLLCARCAAADQGKDVGGMNAEGLYPSEYGRTDQIGWYTPAVPTPENDTYWGYTAVPDAGVAWWKRLPSLRVSDPRYGDGFAPD